MTRHDLLNLLTAEELVIMRFHFPGTLLPRSCDRSGPRNAEAIGLERSILKERRYAGPSPENRREDFDR